MRTMSEIFSKLTIGAPERCHWRCSGVFISYFEKVNASWGRWLRVRCHASYLMATFVKCIFLGFTLTQIIEAWSCLYLEERFFAYYIWVKNLINSITTEFLSYRNQFIDLQSKSMYWFLYDMDLRHVSVIADVSIIIFKPVNLFSVHWFL